MPGMDGSSCWSEARQRSPNDDARAADGLLRTGHDRRLGQPRRDYRYINKPWNDDEIKTIIRAAADAALATDASAVQAEPAAAAQGSDASDSPELLIVDDNPTDREAIRALFGKDLTTHCATSISEALALLETRNIGVIVAEARVGSQDTGPLLRALKQQYPSITTVMLTKAADADLVVKLINQVQIFRFATKPIRTGALQLAVSAAMKEHKRFRTSPSLAKRYGVAPSRELEDATLAASVLKSLSGLRSRLSRILPLTPTRRRSRLRATSCRGAGWPWTPISCAPCRRAMSGNCSCSACCGARPICSCARRCRRSDRHR